MIISTKGRYALSVMVDLAEHPGEGFIPLQEIADRHAISKEYLSSILKLLVADGQLVSLRGKGGGYRLSEDVSTYRVGDIIRLVEGDLAPVACVQEEHPCPNAIRCPNFTMWDDLYKLINAYLDEIYLTDFLPGGRFYQASLSE